MCRKPPKYVALPNGAVEMLKEVPYYVDIYCGKKEKRPDGEMTALCEDCRYKKGYTW